jgi:hypothetical protein
MRRQPAGPDSHLVCLSFVREAATYQGAKVGTWQRSDMAHSTVAKRPIVCAGISPRGSITPYRPRANGGALWANAEDWSCSQSPTYPLEEQQGRRLGFSTIAFKDDEANPSEPSCIVPAARCVGMWHA